jgi:two-component system, NarL family, nitrate/nitrite response regulator NarL
VFSRVLFERLNEKGKFVKNPIKVAIVDDHPIFLAGVDKILSADAHFELIAEATALAHAAELARNFKPDVMLIDYDMSDLVASTVAEVKVAFPRIRLLLLSEDGSEEKVRAAFKAGIAGYVLKGSDAEELCRAICTVSSGDTFVTPTLASKLYLSTPGAKRRVKDHSNLTQREQEVIEKVAEGKTNKEIAYLLDVSEKTIKHHMTNIMDKLCARNRVEVVLRAAHLNRSRQNTVLAHPAFTQSFLTPRDSAVT